MAWEASTLETCSYETASISYRSAVMAISEIELLISELSASLIPPQRYAFEAAARAALAAANCSGCGAAYRVLGPLQRAFWDPPPDLRVNTGARTIAKASFKPCLPSAPRIREPVPAIAIGCGWCRR